MIVVLVEIAGLSAAEPNKPVVKPLEMNPPHISKDKTVTYDFDIVYVRAPRPHADGKSRWTEVGDPRTMEPGADLVLLHPDGAEEVLVAVKPHESITDPCVSFDGSWVYYAKLHDARNHKGADIYKIHVPTRRTVQLTKQVFTPNTGAADWTKTSLPAWGVYNMGPCPVPGGKLAFVSDRNAFKATKPGYAPNALALQLFLMDDDGQNVECIGHLNLGMALHPVILKDGRIMFSSLESQGLRSHHLWGVWAIRPDGTQWGPLVSAFEIGNGTADSTHFQTQLSDGHIVVESYYNLNNFGFGTYYKVPAEVPDGYPAFGPAYKPDPRNAKLRHGRHADGRPIYIQYPFSPHGIEALTPFIIKGDWPSEAADPTRKDSPRVGKFTHPSGAPDNHLLTVWSPGSINSYSRFTPAFDSGIYLIKSGKPIDEPGQMLLVKNDPKYHEQWPRALVPYKRIYGVDEPRRLAPLPNDGKRSAHLPEGTPYGLVGTSSLYKRESYPYGVVRPGTVTATFAGDKDPTGYRGHDDSSHNWDVQGADAGLYSNDEIHAVRILALEPTSETSGKRRFYNHAKERMRILGEIPVRKFKGEVQPTDPDGNPDTSFLAKIPADVAWTFQTLNKDGMLLNMAQTWHQLRPGEIRTDCGGCHAHSQKPTLFENTAAARADYPIFDLTQKTPLLTNHDRDQSNKKWDTKGEAGLRFETRVKTVEFHRDVQPILARSCVACHTGKAEKPAGNLVLDDETVISAKNPAGLGFDFQAPTSYVRLAADSTGRFGHKPLHRHGWGSLAASRYIWQMQSRRSLLIWKVFGKRLDGWENDDLPYESIPGDPRSLKHHGKPAADTPKNRELAHVGFTGSIMPPPEAVAGTYVGADGAKIKVAPLTAEDRLTLVRWIDLGCPIDFSYDPARPEARADGWLLDDLRPTLTLTYPKAGANDPITRLLIGMHDYDSGLDLNSLSVVADFPVGGVAAGQNLAGKFKALPDGRWEWTLSEPIKDLRLGKLAVAVKDRQGNTTRIERTFSVRRDR
jgi:hypothetical protein